MASQWGPSLHVWPLQAPVGASAWSWPQSSQQSSLFHSCASLLCCSLRIPTLPAKLLPICVTAEWRQTGSNLSGFSNTRKRDAFPERRLWKTGRCLVIYKLSLVSLHPRTDQLLHFYFSFSYQHVTQDMSAAAAAAAARCAARHGAMRRSRSPFSPRAIKSLFQSFWTSCSLLCHETKIKSGYVSSIHPAAAARMVPGKACSPKKTRSGPVCAKRVS